LSVLHREQQLHSCEPVIQTSRLRRIGIPAPTAPRPLVLAWRTLSARSAREPQPAAQDSGRSPMCWPWPATNSLDARCSAHLEASMPRTCTVRRELVRPAI
jgi:hypothetical protein